MNPMLHALLQAKKALIKGEIPIGAVIVKNNKIIARGYNQTESKKNIFAHAEIIALKKAAKKTGDWRLSGCEIYVTLQPCLMCIGALYQSRISKVYFGAYDKTSNINWLKIHSLNHKFKVYKGGIKEKECSSILKEFFKNKRKNKM
ncbi:nucleoside deaminase [Candidatus Margulisiibacteriota bacterium]